MVIFLKLLVAHLLGDFLFQPRSWVKEKEIYKIKSPRLYWHVLIHGVLILLLLGSAAYWMLSFIIMICHFGIDLLKLTLQKEKNKTRWFLGDQLLHLISIIGVYYFFFKPNWDFVLLKDNPNFWLIATALLLLTLVSGIVIQVLMQQWTDELGVSSSQSLRSAGKYIGILERLFVFTFILIGHWEAIGFLMAAKSIFRFGDLKEAKDRKLTEYILIGTLLSFGMAITIGLLVKQLLLD